MICADHHPPIADRGFGLPAGAPAAKALQAAFFIVPALFYYLTASRTPGWADAALIVSQVTDLNLSSWVDTHSLFDLLGFLWLKLFRPGNEFFHLVLLGGLFGTLSVFLMYRVVLELTGELLSAGFAALVLMVSHSLWWHSTMLEVYTLDSAIMALMLFFLVRYDRRGRPWHLCASAFACGLGITNHVLMGLFLLAFIALVVFLVIRPRHHVGRHIGMAVLFCFAGAGFYIFLFFRDVSEAMVRTGGGPREWLLSLWQAFKPTFDDATGGKFKQLMFARGLPAQTVRFWRINYGFLLVLNYPTPALAMALYGLWAFLRRPDVRLSFVFFMTALVAQAVWSANYFVWDMFAFGQPVYVLLCVPIGLCAQRLLRGPRGLRAAFLALILPMIVFPGFLYSRIDDLYRAGGPLRRFFDSYPDIALASHTWEPVAYVTNPEKHAFDEVERYARALFAVLPPGAHLLSSDARADYPLRYWYRDRLNQRTDIRYHSLWSPALTEEQARTMAAALKTILDSGTPVFTSSILAPERMVLDHLFVLNDPAWDLEAVRALSTEDFARLFPGAAVRRIVLSAPGEIWIYQLIPRGHGAGAGSGPP